MLEINRIYNTDCLGENGMCLIPDNSIDMVLCDLPYGQTARNKWDTILPFDQLWFQYERVAKENAAIVLFANGMFTADLMKSNAKWWRYNLIWKKTTPTGFLNANKMPLRCHEDICVFYKKLPTYYPQKTQGNTPVHSYVKHTTDGSDYGDTKLGVSGGGSTERFPKSVLEFATDKQKAALHPTQKPVKLLEYLIRTYTNEHDLVLDNCMGSGTTAIACLNINRCFIGFESDNIFYTISENRILKEFGSECFGYKGRGSKNQ